MFKVKKSLLLSMLLINSCSLVVATDDKTKSSPVRNRLNEAANYAALHDLNTKESGSRLEIEVAEFEAKAQMERTAMAMKNYIHMKLLSRDLSQPSIEESRLLLNILLGQNKLLNDRKELLVHDHKILKNKNIIESLDNINKFISLNNKISDAIIKYVSCKESNSLEVFSKTKSFDLLKELIENLRSYSILPIYAKVICYLDRATGYKFVPGNCECRDCMVILRAVKN